ncbi:MAG: T9SS type A sorting domain-containing protein [candidate division Zixibacteria bacterium]|nr:T9SS type A sorting domain-containing protein [candidate division Zixibacteria bacterium]
MSSANSNGANILRIGKFFLAFLIIILSGYFLPIFAGWSESVRLTYRGHEIHPQVIARNDTVHVVWYWGDNYTSYMRSTDGDETWDSLINLSDEGHYTVYPDLSIGENGLFVTWQNRDIFYTIGYSTSIDGSTWSSPEYIYTDNLNDVYKPASTVKGDSIFITYFSLEDDSTGMNPIRYFSSYNDGLSWSDEITVGYPLGSPQDILLKYCHGVLLLTWSGVVDSAHANQYHVVGYRSDDAGQTWSDLIWISPDHWHTAQSPCLSCNDETGQFAVGYMDYRYQEYSFHGDVFISISDDGGRTWPSEVQASTQPTARMPAIEFYSDTLLATWSDRRFNDEGDRQIIINRSNNSGATWGGEQRLTYTTGLSTESWVSAGADKIHLVWREDLIDEGNDIFYKSYTPDSTVIVEGQVDIPETIDLTTYPNPFNSSLTININSQQSGKVQIYDMLGRIINEFEYVKGINLINWNAHDISGNRITSGVYFIKTKGGDSQIIKKIILLR